MGRVQLLWLGELLNWIQPRLPPGFRAYVGSVPALTLEGTNGKPDVTVSGWQTPTEEAATPGGGADVAPDSEAVAIFTVDPQQALHVDWQGQLIAAVEIVSPKNKDRIDSKARYSRRYLGYLRQGVHLLLIDLPPRPVGFSFADASRPTSVWASRRRRPPVPLATASARQCPTANAWAPSWPSGVGPSRSGGNC